MLMSPRVDVERSALFRLIIVADACLFDAYAAITLMRRCHAATRYDVYALLPPLCDYYDERYSLIGLFTSSYSLPFFDAPV